MSDAARECMARLAGMDRALAEMGPDLPPDMQALGAEARRRVALWLGKLAAGDADLRELSTAMAEITGMMNALTARLLLVPWDPKSHPRG